MKTKHPSYIAVEKVEQVFSPKDNSDLGRMLGLHPSRISQCRCGKGFPVRTILKKFKQSIFEIEPIMELEIIPVDPKGLRDVKLLKKKFIDKLKQSNGVYIFYDSLGKAIYIGKTKRIGNEHLFGEIKNAWDRQRDYQQRIRTKKSHSFTYQSYKLKNASHYISAYAISDVHISLIEALLTRILPNNLTNKKIESLKVK